MLPESPQRMRSQALLKKIPINRLSRRRSLPGGNDHLAISWGHAAGGIDSSHACPHALVYQDLAFGIGTRAEYFREPVMVDFSASGEQCLHFYLDPVI